MMMTALIALGLTNAPQMSAAQASFDKSMEESRTELVAARLKAAKTFAVKRRMSPQLLTGAAGLTEGALKICILCMNHHAKDNSSDLAEAIADASLRQCESDREEYRNWLMFSALINGQPIDEIGTTVADREASSRKGLVDRINEDRAKTAVGSQIAPMPPIAPPLPEKAQAAERKTSAPSTTRPQMAASAACVSSYAQPMLKEKSVESIVDEGLSACSSKADAVKAAYIHDFGTDQGSDVFVGIERNVRGIMLRRISEAKRLRGYR